MCLLSGSIRQVKGHFLQTGTRFFVLCIRHFWLISYNTSSICGSIWRHLTAPKLFIAWERTLCFSPLTYFLFGTLNSLHFPTQGLREFCQIIDRMLPLSQREDIRVFLITLCACLLQNDIKITPLLSAEAEK